MIDFTEVSDGETWELFARDFLTDLGFFIESPPDRGADQGKDMIATERLSGALGNYKMKWLVSCKNFAVSGRAVSEADEQNIVERVSGFHGDGFIDVYSTLPTANLNTRLTQLRDAGHLKDYRIFDHKLIESYLTRVGYSHLVMRYFPESYKVVRPLHLITDEYMPIQCGVCGKDLLEALYRDEFQAVVNCWHRADDDTIVEITTECKGACSDQQERKKWEVGLTDMWEDISDLATPVGFLKAILAVMHNLQGGRRPLTDDAYQQFQSLIIALSQKVLRENTGEEKARVADLLNAESVFAH